MSYKTYINHEMLSTSSKRVRDQPNSKHKIGTATSSVDINFTQTNLTNQLVN